MKPKTKLQKQVVELSNQLPPLTEAQRAYPYKSLFKNTGYYWKKGEVWCQCCGYVDEVLKPSLAVSIGVGTHVCPQCGESLVLEHWNQSNRRYSNEKRIYSIIQPYKGWMVIRSFDVQRNNTKGTAAEFFMSEIYQNWISEDGKEVILGKQYTRSPFHFTWNYDSEMDVKFHNHKASGYYEMQDVFDVSDNYFYPVVRVTPILKRNGWTNKLLKLRVSVIDAIRQLLSNPVAETMVKTGQLSVFRHMLLKGQYTIPYVHALNICNRNEYIIDDASIWFDYMDMLAYFNMDTHNARYVCPRDLKAEHDKLMKRKRRIENKRQLEERLKEAAQWEEKYKKEKGRFFGLCINAEDIVITVLQSVSEFVEEAEIMHHCVYSNQYFKNKNSLILSAKDKEGKHLETVELNLATMQVVQSRGVCNKNTEYHNRIIGLVKQNIGLIRQKVAS